MCIRRCRHHPRRHSCCIFVFISLNFYERIWFSAINCFNRKLFNLCTVFECVYLPPSAMPLTSSYHYHMNVFQIFQLASIYTHIFTPYPFTHETRSDTNEMNVLNVYLIWEIFLQFPYWNWNVYLSQLLSFS